MTTAHEIQSALGRVKDQASFLQGFLHDAMHWPVERGIERCDDIAYEWTAQELQAEGLDQRLVDGQVLQIRPFTDSQPWGVFLLEFKDPAVLTTGRGMTGPLRKVLRGLVPKRRASANQATQKKWEQENLLFISTYQYRHFRFSYFRAPLEAGLAAPLATFGWNEGDTHLRTLCDHNLPPLVFPENGGQDPGRWLESWRAAFDVEAVTKRFFDEYREVFEGVERALRGPQGPEARRLYTQCLFNRLMFAYFVQKKGWLEFEGRRDYLRAMYQKAEAGKEDFLNDRLFYAFFAGFNTGDERIPKREEKQLQAARGKIPFLNGGLFEMSDELDARGKVELANAHFARILSLFERYNFTVTESTPLDIEVAVDPEMLGKVFEELVTGRHESGSYYTPRPVVSFMCRDALKAYLGQFEKDQGAVEAFVDHGDPSGLHNPERILQALRGCFRRGRRRLLAAEPHRDAPVCQRRISCNNNALHTAAPCLSGAHPPLLKHPLKDVKVLDPACGSGAYLLGMMHELLRLRAALFKSDSKLDAKDMYQRKLEIIENNLYGVDLDLFAVNIAMLRLWLSLIVEYDGDEPPPLPNLEFKIGCGDSLTAPDPLAGGDDNMFVHRRNELANGLAALKGQYMNAHDYAGKKRLREKIAKAERELQEFAETETRKLPEGAFDWRVRFCEVFAPRGGMEVTFDGRFGFVKDLKPQKLFTVEEGQEPGGFDIVVGNPPYIRIQVLNQTNPKYSSP